jgi:hypothetical protein
MAPTGLHGRVKRFDSAQGNSGMLAGWLLVHKLDIVFNSTSGLTTGR